MCGIYCKESLKYKFLFMTVSCFYRIIGVHLDDDELFSYFFTNFEDFKNAFMNKSKLSEEQIKMYLDNDPYVDEFVDYMIQSLYDYTFDSLTNQDKLECYRITHDVGEGFVIGIVFEKFDVGKCEEYVTDLYDYKEKLSDVKYFSQKLLQKYKLPSDHDNIKLYTVQDDCYCCS
jgi:hypothetical protein